MIGGWLRAAASLLQRRPLHLPPSTCKSHVRHAAHLGRGHLPQRAHTPGAATGYPVMQSTRGWTGWTHLGAAIGMAGPLSVSKQNRCWSLGLHSSPDPAPAHTLSAVMQGGSRPMPSTWPLSLCCRHLLAAHRRQRRTSASVGITRSQLSTRDRVGVEVKTLRSSGWHTGHLAPGVEALEHCGLRCSPISLLDDSP